MPPRRSPRNLTSKVDKTKFKEKTQPKKIKRSLKNKNSAQTKVTLQLYSPTKARRWDSGPASPGSSPNYTLTMANSRDLDKDVIEMLCEDRWEDADSDSENLPSDIEVLIPEWEDYVDPHSEFKWLEVIDGKVTYQQNNRSPVKQVGDCRAFLIRRNQIADTFWDDMEEPEDETAKLAFELFDRFGCLQPQYKEHPVKRGSGVWGGELNHGDILLIEELVVPPTHRRQRIGSMLARAVLELASKKSRKFVGITWPGILEHEVDQEISRGNTVGQEAIRGQLEDTALSFWRALGFRRIGSSRWLGYSPDEQHPSRSLAPEQDFDLPHLQKMPSIPEIEHLIKALPTTDDAECLTWLRNIFDVAPPDDTKWETTDENHNTLLHLVPCFSKSQSTQWLIQKSPNLLSRRNVDGNTPLEALEASMERERTTSQYGFQTTDISDLFTGFNDATVSTLAVLRGLVPEQMSQAELSRLKFGCVCGNCLEGFLSPRLRDMLLFVAEITFDFIYIYGDTMNGESWCEENESLFEYLPESIAQSLAIHKDSRTGFCMLWKYLADCIKENMLPTESNIMLLIRNANEWPPHCRNFIQKGGAISSAATMLFKRTMELEQSYHMDREEPIDLPTCRNDREIGMASVMCGYEGVPRIQNITMQGKKIRYSAPLVS